VFCPAEPSHSEAGVESCPCWGGRPSPFQSVFEILTAFRKCPLSCPKKGGRDIQKIEVKILLQSGGESRARSHVDEARRLGGKTWCMEGKVGG